jgi:NAD(P)-dependent dehydrogenase (short-subunit alcohol dehydrogenase family)
MTKSAALRAAAITAGCVAWSLVRLRPRLDLTSKVALVTGGSRGLGLQLAREFGARGAVVAICARDRSALDRAEADLIGRGIKARAFVCDVSDREQVQLLISEVVQQLGPIDVLVNNAGIIRVGPFEQMELSDFEQAMGAMFWGTLYTTLAVLPSMRQRREGSICNIISIGGKVSMPHLLPYSCAKFAAIGLSEGLHSELSPAGTNITTVVPGLMRTGSHLNAQFKGNFPLEYGWFSSGAATSVVSIGVENAARSIVRAVIHREREKILSLPAQAMARLHDVLPELTGAVLETVNRMLPSDPAGPPHPARSGTEIEAELNSTLWKSATSPGRQAAASHNQLPAPAKQITAL